MRDEAGCTPLHRVCQYGHKAVVHRLLKEGVVASLAIQDADGLTLFLTAVKYRHSQIVELLEEGADINARY